MCISFFCVLEPYKTLNKDRSRQGTTTLKKLPKEVSTTLMVRLGRLVCLTDNLNVDGLALYYGLDVA